MRKVLLTFCICNSLFVTAKVNTYIAVTSNADTAIVDTARTSPFTFDGYLFSRYVWRGVNFGASPSIQGQLTYTVSGFTAGCFIAKSLNGNAVGFSNTSNIFLSYKYKSVSITVDDYFFYDEDNLDRYLDWSDTTLHFIETRLRYDNERYYGFIGYNVYGAEGINKDAAYIEAGYKFPKHGLSLFAGYLTGKSDLNFSTKAGLTNIGVTKEKRIHISGKYSLPLIGSLIINPNYKHIVDLPRVARNFITMVIGVSF